MGEMSWVRRLGRSLGRGFGEKRGGTVFGRDLDSACSGLVYGWLLACAEKLRSFTFNLGWRLGYLSGL